MSVRTAVKSIQDIMRQDVGVDGDAQPISQLCWMFFLKIIDDQDQELELMQKGLSRGPRGGPAHGRSDHAEIPFDLMVPLPPIRILPGVVLMALCMQAVNRCLSNSRERVAFLPAFPFARHARCPKARTQTRLAGSVP
jgi:hypothetical protein